MTTPPARIEPAEPIRANRLYVVDAPVPLNVGQVGHCAFPWLDLDPVTEDLTLVYRYGTTHTSKDGSIVEATSTDGGATYSSPRILRQGGNGVDHRDPCGGRYQGRRNLSWFIGTTTNNAAGCFTMREWSGTFRVDGGLPYAAMCGPMVELPDGRMGGAFYGRKTGEMDGPDTSFMCWSGDGGYTWTNPPPNRVANNISAGVAHNEPMLLVDQDLVHVFYRWGTNDGIGMRTTSDSGASQWTPSRKILNNASGRPSVARTAAGAIVMVYRERPTGAARIAYSLDRTATWLDGGVLMPSGGGLGCVYASMVPRGTHGLYGVVAMEQGSSNAASLFKFELGVTPAA